MPNTKYIRGSNFERQLLNKLREKGYDGIRSAGSHSPADLIVWCPMNSGRLRNLGHHLYAIQCKTSQSDVNLSELIWEDSIRELTAMPEIFTKVLCVKVGKKITQLVWKHRCVIDALNEGKPQGYNWTIENIFDLK